MLTGQMSTTMEADQVAEGGERGPSRTPRGAKLPQVPLDDTLPVVRTLSDLAAPSSSQRIAQSLGTTSTSSSCKQRVAAAGYYGFIRRSGDRYEITDRGEAVIGPDGDVELRARREALMSSGFGQVIYILRGREANEDTIAARLQDDSKVPEPAAKQLAKVLITSVTQAKLQSNNRFDVGPIEEMEGVLETAEKPTKAGSMPSPKRVVADDTPREASRRVELRSVDKATPGGQAPPFRQVTSLVTSSSLQVVLMIDAANLSPEQIVQLFKELRTLEQDD